MVGKMTQAVAQDKDAASLLEGIKLVARQFEDVFKRYHCLRIPALQKMLNESRMNIVRRKDQKKTLQSLLIVSKEISGLEKEAGFKPEVMPGILKDNAVRLLGLG